MENLLQNNEENLQYAIANMRDKFDNDLELLRDQH